MAIRRGYSERRDDFHPTHSCQEPLDWRRISILMFHLMSSMRLSLLMLFRVVYPHTPCRGV